MSKKRVIISYDKLTIAQKKQVLKYFPDGYGNHLTTIKMPTGVMLEALIWETDECIYLVKINKSTPRLAANLDDEEDDVDEDDLEKVDEKDADLDADDEEEEPDYDKPDDDDGDDTDDDDTKEDDTDDDPKDDEE